MGSPEPTLEAIREPSAEDYEIIGQAACGRCLVIVVEKKAASGQLAGKAGRPAVASTWNEPASRADEGL